MLPIDGTHEDKLDSLLNEMLFYELRMNPPKIAVIGCGAWGQNLVRNFSELGALKGIWDPQEILTKSVAEKFSTTVLTEEKVWEDPEIQGVVIASPPVTHMGLAKKALDAGKHVYLEKPMTLSKKDAEDLCSHAIQKKKHLMIGHILNYHPAYLRLQLLIQSGQLGKIHHIQCNRLNLGRFRHHENVFWDLSSHDVSIVLAMAKSRPKRIHANGFCFMDSQKPANVIATLHFEDGLTAHFHSSWVSPFKEQRMIVVGENAMAILDDTKPWEEKLVLYKDYAVFNGNQLQVNPNGSVQAIEITPAEPLKNECKHFLESIQNNTRPKTDGEEGMLVTYILEEAETSLNSGLSRRLNILQPK